MYFNGTKCGSLALCCVLSLSLSAKNAKTASVDRDLRKPICFVENKGQVVDQYSHPRTDIQYKLSTPGMTLYVGNGQLHYQFRKTEGNPTDDAKITTYRMDMSLIGANPSAVVVPADKQNYYENYYLAQLGNTGFSAYSWNKVVYKDVYPNIDWVLYVKGSKVEYDFVVRPGGKVSDIKLQYDGTTSLNIAEDGGLAAETPMGSVHEKKPFTFENGTGKEIASSYKLHNNIVTFQTGAYKGAITIDPALQWSTYFGGTGDDVATSIADDGAGNTYVGGYTASASMATVGAFMSVYQGGVYDAFFAKYDATGALQFATYVGGTGTDQGTSVAVESGGANAYLAGTTTSAATGLTTPGAYHSVNNGGNDGFLIKFSSLGIRQWCTFYGGLGNDLCNSVATDLSGNVFIAGQTSSNTLIATVGAYQAARSGTNDAFLAKFDAAGTIQWSTYYGGTAQEQATAVKCGTAGDIYITGQTNSLVNMASAGAYQATLSGTNDAFIARFNTAGTRDWGTYFGGSSSEQGNAIAVDPASGKIAIAGNTNSATGIASTNGFQGTFGGVQDAFVAYFDASGGRIWSTYYGGLALDYGQAVCFDIFGNIVAAGGTFSSNGIASAGSSQSTIGGDYDAYIVKFNTLGQRLWGTYFGGTFYDYANGITCNSNNQLTIAGHTSSNGLYGSGGIVTAGAAQLAYGGSIHDGFVAKFEVDTFVVISQPFTDTLVCAGGNLNVTYTVFPTTAVFQAGNTFTIQLSDATGSFASPVNIGSVAAVGSGVVPCTIPALTPAGSNYRIRVVASNPAYTSPDDNLDIRVAVSIGTSTASAITPVCVGNDLHLYTTSPYTVSSYSWSGPAGFTSALQNPTRSSVTLAYAGTYIVTTVHNGCPASSSSVVVEVNDFTPPTPSITATSGCAGSTLFLFSSPDTVATGIIYSWVGPGGFTSTLQNPTIPSATTGNSGYYFVQDTIGGCPSAQTFVYVTVHPVLPVSLSISATPGYTPGAPGDTICAGTLVTFTAFPTNGGSTPTYQWMTGPSSPVIGAVSNTWAASTLTDGMGVYCVLTSSALCPSPANANSNVIKMNVITHSPVIYIYATPGVHVTPGSSITFHSAVYDAGIAPTYQWKKNGIDIPGATNDTYVLAAVTHADTITLEVTSTMACTANPIGLSSPLVVNTNVGVTNISAALEQIALFPNPNNGSFRVKGLLQNAAGSVINFDVANLLGQAVYSSNAKLAGNDLDQSINISDLAPGVYFLRVSLDGNSKIFRFTVAY